MRNDLRRTQLERHPLVQVDQLGQARRGANPSGRPPIVGPSNLVAEHVEVRRAAVDQPDGHARVDRMEDRALSLDPEQVASLAALDDETFGRAGKEVGNDRVDGDPPAGDRDPGLPRRHEDGAQPTLARFEVELAGRRSSSRSRSRSQP